MDFLHLILNIILNSIILRILFMKFTLARWFPMTRVPAMNPIDLPSEWVEVCIFPVYTAFGSVFFPAAFVYDSNGNYYSVLVTID